MTPNDLWRRFFPFTIDPKASLARADDEGEEADQQLIELLLRFNSNKERASPSVYLQEGPLESAKTSRRCASLGN